MPTKPAHAGEAVSTIPPTRARGSRQAFVEAVSTIGVDPVTATAIIGHDTSRMRNHYSTVRPQEVREASELLASMLRRRDD